VTERIGVQSFPLAWPDGWKRTQFPRASAFGRGKLYTLTPYSAAQDVMRELALLGARKPVISSNLKCRADGVPYAGLGIIVGAVAWMFKRIAP